MTENDAPGTNNGIVVSGDARVRGTAMAAGRGAQAHHGGGTDASGELLALLAEFRRRLDSASAQEATLAPEARGAARAETDVLKGELVRPEPDPGRIAACVERLRTHVADAAGLTTVLTGMQAGVQALGG